jgi:hypothetical protein
VDGGVSFLWEVWVAGALFRLGGSFREGFLASLAELDGEIGRVRFGLAGVYA